MTEWKKVRLKDICSNIIDCVNKTAPVCDYETPYRMLRTSDIRNGQINTEGLKCVTKETFEKWNRRGYLQEGDVIFTREAPVGEVGLLHDPKNLFLGQRLILFRTNYEICDNRFLFYSLSFRDNKQAIIAKSNGSTVNHLRVPECENIEISLPPLPTQHRIATILSRYDSLIENYQKQIKLLEEAAQRLYKEWFVDLRFSGYENTKVVDGVPEGWEKKKLGEIILKSIGGGWGKDYPQEKFDKEGFVIRGTDISKLKYGNLDEIPFRFHTESNLKERTLCDGDIIFEVSGGSDKDPVGRMYFMTKPILDYYKKDVICASFCKKISFPNKLVSLLCFYAMQYCRNSGDMKKYEKDSAGNIINFAWTTFLENFHMLVPNENFLKNFYKIANANINQQVNISLQIRLLTEARDRLLPKVMGGEINLTQSSPSTSSAILASPRSSSSLITSPRSSSSLLDSPTSPKI